MCNLYSLNKPRNQIAQRFGLGDNRLAQFEPLDAIFPAHSAPIIRLGRDREREMVIASWGFVLPQSGKAPRRVTNVRDDKIRQSAFWCESFSQRRCLVPASSFCEPDSNTPARWHWFALDGEDPRPLFAFPGIWRRWVGPVRKDGPPVDIDTYSFMTTAPNALTAKINHERMPVLLSTDAEFETWLSGSEEAAFGLVHSFDPNAMRIVQAGPDKRDLGLP